MIPLVLGFGAELAKETGAWLDRLLPAPRLRAALRSWRRRRPFWAGVWTVLGGLEMIFLPLAPLPLMLKVGIGAMSAIGVGLVLIVGGLFFVFAPAQRMFVSFVTAIASLVSLATTNLGGFGIGVGLGLLGSSMAFGWLPHAARDRAGEPVREARPKARESRAAARAGTGAALTLVLVLTAALTVGAPERSVAADRCVGSEGGELPWPLGWLGRVELPWVSAGVHCAEGGAGPGGSGGVTEPGTDTGPDAGRRTGERADDGPADPSPPSAPSDTSDLSDPSDPSAPVTSRCLSGIDTGGADNPPPTGKPPSESAKPGEVGEPDDLTALRPPLVVGDQPGPGRATYPVTPYHPTVGATRLTATDAVIHGATYLPTVGGGRIKVLWVHAERIVARDYHFEVTGPDGSTHVLDVQLDIRNVDVYATYLSGAVEIPFLKVKTPKICVGADVVPANLPVAVRLPELTMAPVTAGQVLVDAADVRYTVLSSAPRR
ncbi:DUF6114 domain-containing protein [Streptomyces sp. NPDC059002]|uniref:DUF6114 domain-containing protein n=1 Tax=Streptomyces sp. NPDC059002 TaxID=3346690 RepID=UPI00367C9E11